MFGIPVTCEKGAATLMENNRGSISVGTVWQSPVPYLLGGVLAMILLVAVALVVLVLSNWKKPGLVQTIRNESVGRAGGSNGNERKNDEIVMTCSDDKQDGQVTVIMAGDEIPTFLAMPTMLGNPAGGDISVIII
jgi:hypothetical protein